MIACIYLGLVVPQATEANAGVVFVRHNVKVTSFIVLTTGFIIPTLLLLLVQFHSTSAENQQKSVFVSISLIV